MALTSQQLGEIETLADKLKPHAELRTIQDFAEQGQLIRRIRAAGPRRWGFNKWITERLGMSKRSVYGYLDVARLCDDYAIPDPFPLKPKSFCTLAEPLMPPAAVQKVLELVKTGFNLTDTQIREIAKQHRGGYRSPNKCRQHCFACGTQSLFAARKAGSEFTCSACGAIFSREWLNEIIWDWYQYLRRTLPIQPIPSERG